MWIDMYFSKLNGSRPIHKQTSVVYKIMLTYRTDDDQKTILFVEIGQEGRVIPKACKDGEIEHKGPPTNIVVKMKCPNSRWHAFLLGWLGYGGVTSVFTCHVSKGILYFYGLKMSSKGGNPKGPAS